MIDIEKIAAKNPAVDIEKVAKAGDILAEIRKLRPSRRRGYELSPPLGPHYVKFEPKPCFQKLGST